MSREEDRDELSFLDGGAAGARGVPQARQNLAGSGLSCPQFAQIGTVRVYDGSRPVQMSVTGFAGHWPR